jgi:CelD/BcsL family acetyltransferase involved in cellulose biosynthesis
MGLVVDVHDGTGALETEWDELVDETGVNPFLRPGWEKAWWRYFGKGKLQILAARQDGRLVGVLPVSNFRGELRSPTNAHTPVFGFISTGESVVEKLTEELFSMRPRRIELAFVDADDRGLDRMGQIASRLGYRVLVRTIMRSPRISTDTDREAYEKHLGSKLRSDLRRRRRRLDEKGSVTFHVSDGSEGLDELLAEGFSIEGSGWKASQGTAIESRPETKGFYTEVARWSAERGWLRIAFLRLDGRPIAFDFCLEERGVHFLIKTGYDPGYRKYAPGMLMREHMISRAFSDAISVYDFLGEDSEWKHTWATELRDRVRMQAFSPSPIGRAEWLAYAYGRPLAKRALTTASQFGARLRRR